MRPHDGMLVAALRHRGEDVLAERPDPWTGCPLLYPWASRLSTERLALRGRTVDASGTRRDERGVPLDDRLLPAGPSEEWAPPPFELERGDFDESLTQIEGPFALEGGDRRVEVEFLEGAPHAQFFAPLSEPVACFEPMAAPVDALVSGEGLGWAPWRMRFAIRVS